PSVWKKQTSTFVALAEKTAKFAPFSTAVAPRGYGLPSLISMSHPPRGVHRPLIPARPQTPGMTSRFLPNSHMVTPDIISLSPTSISRWNKAAARELGEKREAPF